MSDLAHVLEAFQEATKCEAGVWTHPVSSNSPRLDAGTSGAPTLTESGGKQLHTGVKLVLTLTVARVPRDQD